MQTEELQKEEKRDNLGELEQFLTEITAIPGLPGHESKVGDYVEAKFSPYCHSVTRDVLENVYAVAGTKKIDKTPRVMLCAHMDEIGLIVTEIDDDGFLRFDRMGGVDPRILPGLEVTVHGTEPLLGVVGMVPPHLQQPGDQNKALKMDKLHIDIGFPAEKARKLVSVGDRVTMHGPGKRYAGTSYAAKTLDDRAGVAMMYVCAKELGRLNFDAEVTFVASSQEEVGCRGANVAAYTLNPDMAIAIDVTHGKQPGAKPFETFALDKPVLAMGPNIHPKLLEKIKDVASERGIDIAIEPCPHVTWTDAGPIQIAREGIPTLLMQIPQKYMHTTVEMLDLKTLVAAGRLMAEFIAELSGWEEWLCS